ncbi:hypothetical protein NKT77_10570 [Moraxella sp. FZLJ2107]|uniref:hypothetical protein n=1 Tax=unclassified Moraxella TaxID=2685852 RepID=UPI0020C8FF28|nr:MULTISPECIES: hypothetical protein [unclassified Moraxella]UTO04918.1 hypothetical protein NKT77_10570 [Moraxella sp. FZLJ2107]UTO21652.1 hypothetical protein NKU06_07385 [Moraxella sp. FZLJ2109]
MKNLDKVIGFKKSEILQIIKEFDPTFSFDSHSDNAIHHPKPLESKHQQQIADLQAENAHLKAHIAELESQLNQANITPAIKHTNTALQALHDVLVTHWQDYDPSQPKTRPKQDFIKAWIVENYPEIEPSKALWIDKIIRHGTHD